MSFIYDYSRHARIGLPEAIFCEGKSHEILNKLIPDVAKSKNPILLTRLFREKYHQLSPFVVSFLDYHSESKTAFINGVHPKLTEERAVVVTAGTSDLPVALETCRTLEYLGIQNSLVADVGVAALWRLQERLDMINQNHVIIVIAGMDAALVSVLGGLTPRPLIAVPTSIGYGAVREGTTALHAMLTSCAPGIPVMNIDNGYGAACAASRIIRAIS